MAKQPEAPSPEDAFIREVDEEYRRDQMASFWTRYGRWLLIIVGLGLIALAAFLWWREEKTRELGEVSEQYTEALQGLELGKPEAKAEIDRIAAGEFGGYATLARFKQADIAIENGDNPAALGLYRALAADESVPKALQQLATLKSVRLEYDDAEPDALIAKLRPIATPGSPWFGVAGEMLGVAYIRDGKPELAGPIFSEIAKSEGVAPGLRQRAQQLAASLGAVEFPEFDEPAAPTEAASPSPSDAEAN